MNRTLLAAVLAVLAFSARGYVQVADTRYSLQTAERIASTGHLDIEHVEGATLAGRDGRSYSKYGIGLALYYVPFVAVARGAASLAGVPSAQLTGFLISFANVPLAVLALVAFARAQTVLGVPARLQQVVTLALALGTLFWRYAVHDFSEMGQLAFLMLAVAGVLVATTQWLLVAGLAFGALVTLKLVHVVLLPLFLGYVWMAVRAKPDAVRKAAVYVCPILACLAFIGLANLVRFGSPFESGYGSEAYQFRWTQVPQTIPSLLVSLDRGLLIFSPILVLGLLGWPRFLRRYPAEALLCGSIVACELVLAAAWYIWSGAWSWGPRLLVPVIPLVLLPAGLWLMGGASLARYRLAVAATIAAVILQMPGVLVSDHQIHHIKENVITPEERASVDSDYVLAWHLIRSKIQGRPEIYDVADFTDGRSREIDLTAIETFQGIDVWPAHLWRYYARSRPIRNVQADSIITSSRSRAGVQPNSRRALPEDATSTGGSPARLGPMTVAIGFPVTLSAQLMTSRMVYPSPPQPRL